MANFPGQQNIDIGDVGKLWMEVFGNKDDGLMETAITLVLMDAKYWPTIREIRDAIAELTTVNYSSAALRQLGEPPRSRSMPLVAKKALEAVKNGRAKEYLSQIDIGDVRDYVKNLFPDISDSLIRQNYNELAFAAESAGKCEVCMWDAAGCETSGYYPVPRLEKEGYVRLEYTPCTKKRKK